MEQLSNGTMKLYLHFLFPFVFWVSFVVSVFVRIWLWNIFAPYSEVGNKFRVFGDITHIERKKNSTGSKYTISVRNFRVETKELGGQPQENPENFNHFVGRSIEAIGTLDFRVTGKKIPDFVLHDATVSISSTSQGSVRDLYQKMSNLASSVHRVFVKTLGNYFSQDELSLFLGMLLGTKEDLSSNFYQQLQDSGLLHLVAASGYNISIVLAVSSILVSMIASVPFSTIFVILLTILYVFVSGGQASVVRASLVGVAGYLASQFLGSPTAAKRLFSLVALLMLWIWPDWVFDVGYQLSVAATAGLLWLAGPIGQIRLMWPVGRIKRIPTVSESLAASLATLPVLLFNFGWDRVSWAGVLVNPIAGIFVGPIMAVGASVVLVGSVWPPGGRILAIAGKPVVVGLMKTIELGAWMNGRLKG